MKTVIEMAREAGVEFTYDPTETPPKTFVECWMEELERFAELVRADERNSWPAEMEAMERQVNILTDALAQAKADEREACARVAERSESGLHCAAVIRARSNT